MEAREADLSAHRAAGRDGSRPRYESEEAPPSAAGPAAALEAPGGQFIEELYWKRFGGDPVDADAHVPDPGSRMPVLRRRDAHAPGTRQDADSQTADLICYLMNLTDDLQKWLAHGSIAPEVLPQVREELRQIAEALDAGASIPPIPEIPLPPRQGRPASSHRGDQEPLVDDEIPF